MNPSVFGHALVHVPPVARELTGSWLRRVALAYGLPTQDLVRGVLSGSQTVRVTGTPNTALEAYLNAPARAFLAGFTNIPLPRLHELLPGLGPTHPRLSDDNGPQAAWYCPARAWVTACPPCTGRAWSPRRPVLVYPGEVGHICRRHRRWLLADERRAVSVPLGTLPEVLAAHRDHVALSRLPGAAGAVFLASAVVWSWQAQRWQGDRLWSQRTSALASLAGCSTAGAAAHALIAYPETIKVAGLLSSHVWQQRLRETASRHGPGAAQAQALGDVGHRVGRPWLADWLTARTRTRRLDKGEYDPLLWWLRRLTHPNVPLGGELWYVPTGLDRPVEYGDRLSFLTDARVRSVIDDARSASLTGGWEPVPLRPLSPG
ncbi:TniQ family protein [Streptomyces sp. NPDC006197]|uniref:TniQ family protein n=1 Tax=Streptomyces sp. NPDC006197 TaxID=3156685 RepID=UPI0033AA0E1F